MTSETSTPLVLIVEDNQANAYIIAKAVGGIDAPASVTILPDLRSAKAQLETIAATQSARPVVVIADFLLPDGNGAELVAWARRDPRLMGTRFIALSAFDDQATVRKAYRAGVHSFVSKNDAFVEGSIAQVVRYWLEVNEPLPLGDRPK